MTILLITLSLNLYMSWRYSDVAPDPDYAMFNLWAMLDCKYGKDFADCKTPMIHLTYLLISKIVGRNTPRIKFLYHFMAGLPGIIYSLISGDVWGGLAFVMLVNSGNLVAFHGNVSQIPAGLFLLAISIQNPWVACSMGVLGVLYDPKLIFTFASLAIIKGWYVPGIVWAIIGGMSALFVWRVYPVVWGWLVEQIITIPGRMNKARPGLYNWTPWWTKEALVYLLPWVVAAVWAKPNILYWLPALCYWILLGFGRVIRPNHIIPLAAWIAASGMEPKWIMALVAIDLLSGGFYIGNIWDRFYRGFGWDCQRAVGVGEWLKDKPGSIWVNSMHTEIYQNAGKKPMDYGLVEQIEIRENSPERRKVMQERWRVNQPDYVVMGPSFNVAFNGKGYEEVAKNNEFQIYKRRK